MSKPFLFLSIKNTLSFPFHFLLWAISPSLLQSFSICLLPLCYCFHLILLFAYALKSPLYISFSTSPCDLAPLYLFFKFVLLIIYLCGTVGISFGPRWTVSLKCPFATQADGLQATVAARGYAFFFSFFFYCKCLEIASILYAPHNLLYVQCQHPVPMQGQVCPLRGQDDGWACLTFMQEVKSLVHVIILSLVFNNFISHNRNWTPNVPISSCADTVECRIFYKFWQWTYILA